MIQQSGAISANGEKSISAGVVWNFDDVSNELTSVANTDVTPGAANYTTFGGNDSVAPNGDTGLFSNADFLSSPFGFLAPTVGSAAGNAYGVGVISGDITGNGIFSIFFPTLEAQWGSEGGIPLTLGNANGGVTFNCDSTNGTFECFSETTLHLLDDVVGFNGQFFQFNLTGTISAVPVPAAAWLFGSGLVGLAGVAGRKKRLNS